MQLGQNSRGAQAQRRFGLGKPRGARARFEPDGRGPGASEREGGEGEERLTGRARLSSLTLRQRAGELTGDVFGHGGVS